MSYKAMDSCILNVMDLVVNPGCSKRKSIHCKLVWSESTCRSLSRIEVRLGVGGRKSPPLHFSLNIG